MKLTGLTATWMKDNKPIGDAMADRVKITAKDNVFTLEVSSVKVEDKGQYTCRVTNAGGEVATCSAQLEVHQRKSSSFINSERIRNCFLSSTYATSKMQWSTWASFILMLLLFTLISLANGKFPAFLLVHFEHSQFNEFFYFKNKMSTKSK